MAIFLTGCTHFGHSGIIKHTQRPFQNVREMNEALTDYWNETVGPKDTVIHHGDFSWNDGVDYLSKLNGNVILLQGNHDPRGWGQDYYETKLGKRKWVMFHYPIEEWDGWFRGAVHTHCHTHKKELVSGVRRFNVGVDSCNLRPINYEDIMELI